MVSSNPFWHKLFRQAILSFVARVVCTYQPFILGMLTEIMPTEVFALDRSFMTPPVSSGECGPSLYTVEETLLCIVLHCVALPCIAWALLYCSALL